LRLLVLATVYFVVAAASFNGFYTKWQLRDGAQRYAISDIMDGTASRPFVYRQLLPTTAKAIEAALPEKLKTIALNSYTMSVIASPTAKDPRYKISYYIIYYLVFLSLFASLFVLRRACLDAGVGEAGATAAPAVFALFFPILQTGGGYFYDFPELLFMAAAVLLGMQGRLLALAPLVALATWNKESFLLFLPTLYPLVRVHYPDRTSIISIGALLVVGGLVYYKIWSAYGINPGGTIEIYFLQNLPFYLSPLSLFAREQNYGLWTLTGYSVFTLLLAAVVVVRGWPGLSVPVRQHIIVAAAINLPLFILLGAPGEIRNLSFLFVGLVFLTAQSLSEWIGKTSRSDQPPAP
jgi:hypothetical protein